MDIPILFWNFCFGRNLAKNVYNLVVWERETGCLIHVSVSVCGYEIQSWSMGLTVCSSVCICDWLSVCSNLGLWVWLCVPILVYVSDSVFQFWSVCLTLCSIFCLYLWLSVCSSPGLSVWPCVPNFVSMIQFLSMCQAVRLKSFCQWWYGIVFIFVSSMLFDWYSIDVKMIFKWNVEILYDLCLMCHIDLSYLQRNPISYKYLYQLY